MLEQLVRDVKSRILLDNNYHVTLQERQVEQSKILFEVRQIIGLVKAGLPSTQTTLLLCVGTTLDCIEYIPIRIKYNYIME